MSKKRAGEELETAFRQVLNQFFYNIQPYGRTDLLKTEIHVDPPAGRHNYQRDIAIARPRLDVTYRGMCLCRVERKPNVVNLVRRSAQSAPKGYFASKVLERVLFYDYPDVRVK